MAHFATAIPAFSAADFKESATNGCCTVIGMLPMGQIQYVVATKYRGVNSLVSQMAQSVAWRIKSNWEFNAMMVCGVVGIFFNNIALDQR